MNNKQLEKFKREIEELDFNGDSRSMLYKLYDLIVKHFNLKSMIFVNLMPVEFNLNVPYIKFVLELNDFNESDDGSISKLMEGIQYIKLCLKTGKFSVKIHQEESKMTKEEFEKTILMLNFFTEHKLIKEIVANYLNEKIEDIDLELIRKIKTEEFPCRHRRLMMRCCGEYLIFNVTNIKTKTRTKIEIFRGE